MDSTVYLVRVSSVDIVDVEILNVEMMQVSGVLRDQVHPAAGSGCRASVRDLEIANLPVLLIPEQYRILGESGSVDDGFRVATVLVHHDGMVASARSFGPELARPS